MRSAILTAARAIRWYLRQASGEAKWDEYLQRCRLEDAEPVSRRALERHRTQHQENSPQVRCC